MMASDGSNRVRLWVVLMVALGGTLVSLVAFVQWERPARADEQGGRDPQIVPDPRIVGGTAVPDGKYAFIAALIDTRIPGNTPFDQQFCGGTLIDENSVLTAGHCVDDDLEVPGAQLPPTASLRVTVGRTVLNSKQGQVRRVSAIFVHPGYAVSRVGATSAGVDVVVYDAAVLELSSPVSGITPIKLATSSQNYLERPGRNATVAGWGDTNAHPEEFNFPDRMRQVRIPVVSDSRADRVYDAAFGHSLGYVPPIMVAAGKKGESACFGDSGGPLFDTVEGEHYQIGIVSGGPNRCGMARYPGRFTEVNSPEIRNFILDAARR
jgi:secreted trypsin-like serine protease